MPPGVTFEEKNRYFQHGSNQDVLYMENFAQPVQFEHGKHSGNFSFEITLFVAILLSNKLYTMKICCTNCKAVCSSCAPHRPL